MTDDSETPRYRVLVIPEYQHGNVAPYHTDGGCHTVDCADIFNLEIYRTDRLWKQFAPTHYNQPMDVIAFHTKGGTKWEIRARVIDWIYARSKPLTSNVQHDHIAVFMEMNG